MLQVPLPASGQDRDGKVEHRHAAVLRVEELPQPRAVERGGRRRGAGADEEAGEEQEHQCRNHDQRAA